MRAGIRNANGEQPGERAEMVLQKIGQLFALIGQAQTCIINSDYGKAQITIEKIVFQEEREKVEWNFLSLASIFKLLGLTQISEKEKWTILVGSLESGKEFTRSYVCCCITKLLRRREVSNVVLDF